MSAARQPSLNEILIALHAQLPELRDQWGVRSLEVFGSYVRGDQRQESDLDLLVQFDDRPLSLLDLIKLEQHLSDLLDVKVDLAERSALKPLSGKQILAEARSV